MDERARLLGEIERDFRDAHRYLGVAALDPRVRDALLAVPRDRFVPEGQRADAWMNRPLPIGSGQTISQPFIVAVMTQLLAPQPDDRVLEIGTGSGYQAAVLSRLVRRVYSVETIAELAEGARAVLSQAGIDNVEVLVADGARGWPEHAPFDRIIVTCAARRVPPALVEQLRPGGRMLVPVEEADSAWIGAQTLLLVEKDALGEVSERSVLPVAFVPLVTADDV